MKVSSGLMRNLAKVGFVFVCLLWVGGVYMGSFESLVLMGINTIISFFIAVPLFYFGFKKK